MGKIKEMKNNPKNVAKSIAVCGLGGVITAATLNGFVCANPQFPEYMCEKHVHLPEKGETGINYTFRQDSSIGTPSPSASAVEDFPYGLPKGGES